MWPNPQFTVDLVTFTEEILKNFIVCAVTALITFNSHQYKSNYMLLNSKTKITILNR